MTDAPSDSAKFDAVVANVVFRGGEKRLFLPFRLHVWADGGLDTLDQIGLFRLGQPGLDLGGVALPLLLVLHLPEEELSFQLFAGKILHVLHKVRVRLHVAVEPVVDLGVHFELASQFVLLFWVMRLPWVIAIVAHSVSVTRPRSSAG